jgi:hypothetical protein
MKAIEPRTTEFYRHVLGLLQEGRIPFLVGGAYALERYAGVLRRTKDLDLFLRARDCGRCLRLLSSAGYRTEMAQSHWLAKVHANDAFVDLIFSSGNGLAIVDDDWFEHAVPDEVLNTRVLLCPPEELLWSKSTIMERHRYDGADVAHLLRAVGDRLDWDRVLERFGPRWRVLFSHLLLFGFIYPGERDRIPHRVLDALVVRLRAELETPPPRERVCQGTFLSGSQYWVDINEWGYQDARLYPSGNLTADDVARFDACARRNDGQDVGHDPSRGGR